MCTQELKIGTIPAVLYGKPAPNIWLFVHGQGGNKTEAAAFAALAAPTGWQVLGIDLPEHGDRTGETDFTPWQVVPELQTVLAYLQQQAVEAVRKRGTVVLFGGLAKDKPMTTLDSNRIHYGEIRVVGAFSYPAPIHQKALLAIRDGFITPDEISKRHKN